MVEDQEYQHEILHSKIMRVADLIDILLKVQEEKGDDVRVKFNSFCGTNNAHISFNLNKIPLEDFDVDYFINGYNEFCLSGSITDDSRNRITEGIESMKKLGYTYYRSQFVDKGKTPESGISPCNWHIPW